jgi:diguanylate cyclase (GGDEF)-like protein
MKSVKPVVPFAPHEIKRFISPLTFASTALLAGILADALTASPAPNLLLAFFAALGIVYLAIAHHLIVRSVFRHKTYSLLNSLLTGIGIGILLLLLPEEQAEIIQPLMIFSSAVVAILSNRRYAYVTLTLIALISLPFNWFRIHTLEGVIQVITPYLFAFIAMEVIVRLQETTQQHIRRLQTTNDISHQIMQTLDKEKTLALLNAALQETLHADTYFVGFVENDYLQLDLFYDEGEYFNGTRVPLDGTLSGWVIKNQKELFLPDLREEVDIAGIDLKIIGKDKTSLSWIGVPLKAENITGILVLASYTANAFDHADLELLNSLGQHVTLALDNALRHAQVEKQARLDSLTGVYNHGYFLTMLAEHIQQAEQLHNPLSLIMLDIDYFKQYNDTYGHLVGDRILTSLCEAIQHNIKQTDAVGRWGGEEFAISLPGANGSQALQIARRIAETVRNLHVEDRDHRPVPIPTVSQGIAVYPTEADEIYRLIDVADRRLYVAKERGRNQIEPQTDFWKD